MTEPLSAPSGTHLDLYANQLLGGTRKLIDRVQGDDPRVPQFQRHGSGYVGVNVPHTDDECPFRDHPIIPMRTEDGQL